MHKHPLLSLLLTLAGLLLQSGCAHYYLPANTLETPEAVGGDVFKPEPGGRIGRLELVGIQSGTDLLSPASPQPTNPKTGVTPNPVLSTSLINYAFGVSVGLTPTLDVGIKIEPEAPTLARIKYQLYGDPESTAQRGNATVAAVGSGGLVFGGGATFYMLTGSVIGGYRFAAHHVVSLAPFLNGAGLSGEGTASGSGLRYGASLGYQYDVDALIVRADLSWAGGSFSQQTGSVNDGGWFPGLLMGLKL